MTDPFRKQFKYPALTVEDVIKSRRENISGIQPAGYLIEVVTDAFQLSQNGRVVGAVDDQALAAGDNVLIDRQVRLPCF